MHVLSFGQTSWIAVKYSSFSFVRYIGDCQVSIHTADRRMFTKRKCVPSVKEQCTLDMIKYSF